MKPDAPVTSMRVTICSSGTARKPLHRLLKGGNFAAFLNPRRVAHINHQRFALRNYFTCLIGRDLRHRGVATSINCLTVVTILYSIMSGECSGSQGSLTIWECSKEYRKTSA